MNVNRIIWIVLDSVGIGEARDAAKLVMKVQIHWDILQGLMEVLIFLIW